MEEPELLGHIDRLKRTADDARHDYASLRGAQAQITEFLREFAGAKSSFLAAAQAAGGGSDHWSNTLIAVLDAFRGHIAAGLYGAISPTRRVQLDVVSDFLEQAHTLLETRGVHPAAPIVLVGATLEEFLRTWIESAGLSIGQRKPSLDTYAQVLLAESLITKQDVKDITAWAGLRNHAAHGQWEDVSEKARASLMLQGVNLLMRKYSE